MFSILQKLLQDMENPEFNEQMLDESLRCTENCGKSTAIWQRNRRRVYDLCI